MRAPYVVQDLDQAECRRLIETVPVGRIASTDRGLPKIVPVHCRVHGNELVIGSIQAHHAIRMLHGDVVAFEADSYDPARREGWCVGVIGPCRLIDDGAEISSLDALDFTPWTSEDGGHYIALPLDLVYGQALRTGHT
jgi:nitroimidazol reductase NimA-like FMN-containing flavoprotein (pyridoxamine 5'-phosphate oxidase superfamily)